VSPPTWLDKKKNNCITHPCGHGISFRGVVERDGIRYTVHSRYYCKRWGCKECGPRQAWLLQQRIAAVSKERDLSRMLTLTLDPKKVDGDPYAHLNESWRKLREAFRREFGHSISFVAVNEYQKNGMPHKHVLVDRYLRQQWVKYRWKRLGGGHQVDIRRIKKMDDPARYICKYLTKGVLINAPKGRKRVTTSRDIKLRDRATSGEWTLCEAELDGIFERAQASATNVVRRKDGRLRSFEIPDTVDELLAEMRKLEFGARAVDANLPEPDALFLELVRVVRGTPEDREHEASGDVRPGIEQGTVGRRLFDPGTEAAP
jgi:hypothetical protein